MKTVIYLINILIAASLISSCNTSDKRKVDSDKQDAFRKSLKEQQIEGVNFYISLPPTYAIKMNEGPDFSVYYIQPVDTTVKTAFTAGLYFGNYPHTFEAPNDSCQITKTNGNILGENTDWTVYHCGERYSIQAIVDSHSGEGWNSKIHSFGHAYSESDLTKILEIYSTLQQKKK